MGIGGKPAALVLDHARGGGSTHFLDLYAARLEAEGFAVVRTRRVGAKRPLYLVPEGQGLEPHLLSVDSGDRLRAMGVERLVYNHLIDLPPGAFEWARGLANALGLEYELVLHDYYLACPQVNLVDATGRFCDLDDGGCRGCLESPAEVAAWRSDAARLLAGAARVIAPSGDLARRLLRVFPAASIEVFEPEAELSGEVTVPPLASEAPLRLLVLGSLNRPKGFDVLLGLARHAQASGAPIELALLGASIGDRALEQAGVSVLGPYDDDDAQGLIRKCAPHAIFFPAIWPETWSFTLTHALRAGVFAIAFDIGAIAERLRRLSTGRILPYALHSDAAALQEALLTLRSQFLQSSP